MYKTGHYGITMILYSPILLIGGALGYLPHVALGLAVSLFLTPIPDSDIRISFLKHRGFTHSVSFSTLVGVFTMLIALSGYTLLNGGMVFPNGATTQAVMDVVGVLGFAFFIGQFGILAHIAGDVITPMGIRPLQKPPLLPNSRVFSEKRYSLDMVYAKNQWANMGFFILGGISILLSFVGTQFFNPI